MFQPNTLLIIGAGAGVDINMPTGRRLTQIIEPKLAMAFEHRDQAGGDREIWSAVKRFVGVDDATPYFEAARTISVGMPVANSIDSFMDIHKDNEPIQVCGKLAIAHSILEAEQGCRLYLNRPRHPQQPPNFGTFNESWLFNFFRILHEGIARADISTLFDHISIINFNYDRCIEYFLVDVVRASYGVSEEEAQEVVALLNIYHPYGTVGPLPWQTKNDGVPFGEVRGGTPLLDASQGIRIHTERVKDEAYLADLSQTVEAADRIIFLGFAFHQENVDLLKLPKLRSVRRVYGTAFEISDEDCTVIKGRLNLHNIARENLITLIGGCDCVQLFDRLHHTFSAG